MLRITVSIALVVALGGCSDGLGMVKDGFWVGGQVRGLWDGAKVVVRLEAGENREERQVGNGSFQFQSALLPGSSYTVTATGPEAHTCEPEEPTGSGVVLEANVIDVSIRCTGPEAKIEISGGQRTLPFDATRETQTIGATIFVQDVSLTIRGATLASANVDGRATELGAPTSPIALPLGTTMMTVALATTAGQTKTYELVFERGTPALEQSAYVKASIPEPPDDSDEFGIATALDGDTLVVGAYERERAVVYVFTRDDTSWILQEVLEASNAQSGNKFGFSVALSGNVLVVGAPVEDGDLCEDNRASRPGAAYVFVRDGTEWTEKTILTPSRGDPGDCFGTSVALSGQTVAVGAPGDDSGIINNEDDDSADDAGAVYVFAPDGPTWTQQAYIKDSAPEKDDFFGTSVALLGATLVVGAPGENSNIGAAYVFGLNGATWALQRSLQASNPGDGDDFGQSVALSADALVVGAPDESSATKGINGLQDEGSAPGAGAVYIFRRTDWKQTSYVKASNTGEGDNFGSSIALLGDMLAVGAPDEKNNATGVNGVQFGKPENRIDEAGAVYVFQRIGGDWTQRAYVKASNTGQDRFGNSVALSESLLVVGAHKEDSGNGTPEDDSEQGAGAVYVFR